MDISFPKDLDISPETDVTGVLLQARYPTGSVVEVITILWTNIYEEYKKRPDFDPSGPFVRIIMPCGCEKVYASIGDIPLVDVPCDCGNKKHWFIKYNLEVICERN